MLILFPHRLGQMKNGVQNTPLFLQKLLKNNCREVRSFLPVDIEGEIPKVRYRKVRYTIVECNNSDKNKYKNMVHNLKNLYISNQSILGRKINIGGDHSMSIATLADSLNKFADKDLKVLWFDAHPDINTYESSESKNFHGMPLSYLTGLNENPDFSFIQHKLNFNNLMYIGIRDIDCYEKKIIGEKNIKYITCDEINDDWNKSLEKIIKFTANNPIHLSFDVDCMDPEIIPCTGTTHGNGLNLMNTKKILDRLVHANIINMDLTEINLELGNEEEQKKTISNTLHLFDKYL